MISTARESSGCKNSVPTEHAYTFADDVVKLKLNVLSAII